jgi:hypothetical protein
VYLKHLAARVPATAAWAVTHPVQTTSRAVGFARGVVAGGIGLVEVLRTSDSEPWPDRPTEPTGPTTEPTTGPSAGPATEPAEPTTEAAEPADPQVDVSTPEYVVAPPTHEPPAEPPVDVVGAALAAEAAEPEPVLLGGTQGEPHPVTREEEHEGAPFVRAEREELDDETDEALEDAADEVLPDQGLVLDPALAKAVRSEAEILQEAADPDKG